MQSGAEGVRMTTVDVGKGDCILVQAGASSVLIDTGYENTSSKVVSYLRGQGVSRIDYLVVTHYDRDHVGGLRARKPRHRAHLFEEGKITVFVQPMRSAMRERCILYTLRHCLSNIATTATALTRRSTTRSLRRRWTSSSRGQSRFKTPPRGRKAR